MVARLCAAFFVIAGDWWDREGLTLESVARIGGCEPSGLLCFGFVFAGDVKDGDVFGLKVGGIAVFFVLIGGTLAGLDKGGCFVV